MPSRRSGCSRRTDFARRASTSIRKMARSGALNAPLRSRARLRPLNEGGSRMFRRMYALRWWMISLITVGTILNYLTRATLGVAAPTLTQELGITETEYSWITGVFQIGI